MYSEDDDLDAFAAGDGFDSREAEERIAFLESWIDDAEDGHADILSEDDAAVLVEYREELAAWHELREETEGYADDSWRHGVFFVADSAFEDHARELAEDIGAIDGNAGWPMGYIDWSRAADALKIDYASVEIRGRTFWYR